MRSVLSYQRLFGKALWQPPRQAACLHLLTGLVLFTWLGISSPVVAATLPTGFTESSFATGLTNPTAMAFAPDGRLFVCQQGGQLRVIKNGVLLATPFVTVTTDSSGERGLLGIAFDPNFAVNQFVYVYYTALTPAIHNRVSRFTASGDVAAGGETIIFELTDLSSATNHNGGALHFGPDGKLYFAAGENANAANSQSIANVLGKILRINSDGTIPADNPTSFPGIAGSPSGNNRAIWSVGLRNPFTFTFQPGTGRLFINDVGQNTWEEINDGIAGSNYGWSICEGFCAPPNANFRDPLFEYGHGSSATTGCAITGGAFYNPTTATFPSDYIGKYFFADFCTGWIRRFDPGTGTSVPFASGISSPVDLLVTTDGSLYYLARGSGSVLRVQFSTPTVTNGMVSGQITDANGNPVEGAVVRLSGTQNRKTITDANGNYNFFEVETNGFYTVTPSRVNYNFAPAARGFSALGARTEASFAATANGNRQNPLDTTEYFVRQQYVDFLGREPEEAGFNAWTDTINNCAAGDAGCDRVRVSEAFFRSAEFQERGYFVYRFYSTAFGRKPDYGEFTPAMARISGFLTDDQLAAEKAQFANDFTSRAAFVNQYGTLSNSAYVDALAQTAGVTLSNRQALVDSLEAGTLTRAQALRQIAESGEVYQRYYNQAFVVMEYFGYLRRDPDALYPSWISVLDTNPTNSRRMVEGFVEATEYRNRFKQ
jgi:glucose/arabinose dehydrogenase